MFIGACWRGHKCRLKKKHLYELKDNKERWNNRPKIIPKDDLLSLMSLWNKKKEKKNEDRNKEPPNLTQLFERTRKRTEGNKYVTYDDTKEKVEKMKRYKQGDGNALVEPFLAVMSKEYDGHRRLYGRGVTNKLKKKMNGGAGTTSIEAEKCELDDKRRELGEDHERMKVELAEEHENKKVELEMMRNNFNSDKNKIFKDAVRKVIEKLPHEVARHESSFISVQGYVVLAYAKRRVEI